MRIYYIDPWLFHGDCFRPTTLSQQFSISALSWTITGMALSCRASYGIFTLYHKSENDNLPLIDGFSNNSIGDAVDKVVNIRGTEKIYDVL